MCSHDNCDGREGFLDSRPSEPLFFSLARFVFFSLAIHVSFLVFNAAIVTPLHDADEGVGFAARRLRSIALA